MTDRLYLHEQVLLLALRDKKGSVESRASMYKYAIGGALLAEMLLGGCMRISEDKKKLVRPARRKRFRDEVLDECVSRVFEAKRRRAASAWVGTFASLKQLKIRIARRLCRRGILRESEDRVLLLFRRRLYPTIDPGPEKELLAAMQQAIFGKGREVEPRIALLVALAHGAKLLPVHFDKKRLKEHKPRLEGIVRGDLVGRATREAVQAAEAAMAASVAVSAAITAATATRH